jgi:hypothetical protein
MALHRMTLFKALFFSVIAVWRNLWAVLVFLMTIVLVLLVVSELIQLLASVVPPAGLLGLVMLIMVPIFFSSFYVSARDIFGEWPDA